MGFWTESIGAIVLLAVSNPADAKAMSKPAYPPAIHGIWFADDADGRGSCKAYLAAYRKQDGTARDFLVGAEVIGPNIWHSYAEYGEGNFYEIHRLTTLGPGSWRVAAFTGIDGLPEHGEAQTDPFRIGLKQGKLVRAFETVGTRPADNGGDASFFRCAGLPKQ